MGVTGLRVVVVTIAAMLAGVLTSPSAVAAPNQPSAGLVQTTVVARAAASVAARAHLTATPTPTISGTGAVGRTLTAKAGMWAPAPVVLKYQWYRNGVAIAGATSSTYKLTSRSAGAKLTVKVTGSKAGYATVSKLSAPKAIAKQLTAMPTPTISGSPKVGDVLSVNAGSWSPEPVTWKIQWKRDGASISGATGSTYKVVASDAGKKITVTVTGSKPGYTTVAKTSAALQIGKRLTVTPTPTISGSAKVGSTLTAKVDTWAPAPVTLAYRWYRDGSAIPGATKSTYKLTDADAGKQISIRVTGSRSGYTRVTKTSASRSVTTGTLTKGTPRIEGDARVGVILRAVTGTWAPSPVGFTYQWHRNGTDIPGATDSTYVLLGTDVGAKLTVTVTGSRVGYATASATSTATAVVEMGDLDVQGGTLTANTTWTGPTVVIPDEVIVPSGITLRIAPGVVVKGRISVHGGGQLIAEGTEQNPVVLTAVEDDTRGGATPFGSDQVFGYTPVGVFDGAAVRLEHVVIWHSSGTVTPEGDLSDFFDVDLVMRDSEIHGSLALIAFQRPVVERTTIIGDGGEAPLLRLSNIADISAVALDGPDSIILQGSELERQVMLAGAVVAPGTSVTLSTRSGVSQFLLDNGYGWLTHRGLSDGVIVAAGAELLLSPGARFVTTAWSGEQITGITVLGLLRAEGTTDAPVEFDNQALAGMPFGLAPGGEVRLSRVDVRGTARSFMYFVDSYLNEDLESVSFVGNEVTSIDAIVDIVDSQFRTAINFVGSGDYTVRRTTIAAPEYGVTFDYVADMSGVAFTGADRITLAGTPKQRAVIMRESSVAAGTTVTLSPDAGVSAFHARWVRVETGGTLTARPGTVVKGGPSGGTWVSVVVAEGAVANFSGTASDPVVYTNAADDTQGGDTGDDGFEEWHGFWCGGCSTDGQMFEFEEGGAVALSHTRIYADGRYIAHGVTEDDVIFNNRNADAAVDNRDIDTEFSVTDSEVIGQLNIDFVERVVIDRTDIHGGSGWNLNGPRAIPVLDTGLSIDGALDVSGVALAGEDAIHLVGVTPASRSVRLSNSAFPAGSDFTLSTDSYASAIHLNEVRVERDATVRVGSGVILKGDQMAWQALSVAGALIVEGNAAAPVVITDMADDTHGGDTGNLYHGEVLASDFVTLEDGGYASFAHVEVEELSGSFLLTNASGENATVSITDSTLRTPLNLHRVSDLVLARTEFAPVAVAPALTLSDVPDVTGIVWSGPDRITFEGTPRQRAIEIYGPFVPSGRATTLSMDSGASAFWLHNSGPAEGGALTLAPGVIVKGSLTAYNATVAVEGTAEDPVIFTDARNDAVGGRITDPEYNEVAVPREGDTLLDVTGGSAYTVEYAVFTHAESAIHVGEFTSLSVAHSRIVNTVFAFTVASAGSIDPGTGYFYATLPCAPPYDSVVYVDDTWFGTGGLPGYDVDALSFAGAGMGTLDSGSEWFDDFEMTYGEMTSQAPLQLPVGTNMRPWTWYSCAEVGFPVTPVMMSAMPPSNRWPQYAEIP